MDKGWRSDLGLVPCGPFYRDREFVLAVLAGLLTWMALPDWLGRIPWYANMPLLLSLLLWQPVLEELFFRGIVQGRLKLSAWGEKKRWGVTQANLLTSVLFSLAHAFTHPPLWAIGVFAPSLLFGHFRDRYGSVYPALALHVYFNAGYFLLGAGY